jgi:hypothetical protein
MAKKVLVQDDTWALLNELKHVLRKRSVDATLREILDDLYDDEDEDQSDLDDFDLEDEEQ